MSELRKINGLRIHQPSRMGFRTIKMANPQCPVDRANGVGPGICQRADGAVGWWHRCEAKGHNPYFQTAERPLPPVPKLSDPDPETGRRTVLGHEDQEIEYTESPNLIPVPVTGRHNGDEMTAIRHSRGLGRRLPEEIGLAPFCQFSQTGQDCWSQDIKDFGELGQYCNAEEARAVAADKRSIKLEQLNRDKMASQWAQIAV